MKELIGGAAAFRIESFLLLLAPTAPALTLPFYPSTWATRQIQRVKFLQTLGPANT